MINLKGLFYQNKIKVKTTFSSAFKTISFLVIGILCTFSVFAQDVTKVSGKVYDNNKQPLPFVNVFFKGTNVGVSTDVDGNYVIQTRFPSDTLVANFLGFKDAFFAVALDKSQKHNFTLETTTKQLATVDIIAEKRKYSKKNNPALELAKKVTANKRKNHLKGLPYYSYDQYEKVRLDLNNITQDFKDGMLFRKFDFLWDYIDTSEINGRTFLPIFMREVNSTKYFRRQPKQEKEHRHAVKYTNLNEHLDANSLNNVIDALYQEIDIYEEEIVIMEQNFVSPLSTKGPDFYRYYIIDTTEVNGRSAINLAFIPATKGNFGFTGNMYISNDDRYTVLKVEMGIIHGINLNFIRDLKIDQEFTEEGDNFIITKNKLVIDYSLVANGLGMYGSKTVYYDNYNFDRPDDKAFAGLETIVNTSDNLNKPDAYWLSSRIEPLDKNDLGLYQMVDTLVKNPTYKRYLYLGRVATTGYVPIGPVEFGPLATFFSFNDVEGLQWRFGGNTTYNFSRKLKLQAYGTYATKVDLWKYSAGATYSFNREYRPNPRHFISVSAERASSFPGQDLAFFSPDNFLLSFRRGETTKMLLTDKYELHYFKGISGFSFELGLRQKRRMPFGSLTFQYSDPVEGNQISLDEVTTGEIFMGIRLAPNEQFIQGKDHRRQIYNEYPILEVKYTQGVNNFLNGNYQYSQLYFNLFKQYEWTTIGTTDIIIDGGKMWGDVPYILQFIPRGNQTYAFQLASYNMMNFLEFTSDQFISFNMEHYFYGYFLNRIPLIRRLKLREIISLKVLYGSLSDNSNPNLNPELIQFTPDADGNPTTFVFDGTPYFEASIGFSNIFKVLRFDFVKRFTYLDQPNLANLFGLKGAGVRAAFLIEF